MSEEEKNGENEIIINIKENNQKSELKLLTLDEYRKKKNLTKFTPKSNKRRIYFQPKINHINHEENIKILQPNNLEIKPDNLKIIEKWKELQKSIKEAISLEELMEEKQMQDNSQLKEKFREYYKVKLECRKEYEIIKNLGNNQIKVKDYTLSNNIERELLDTCEPIKNLMFLLRNRYDYIVILKHLLKEEPEKIDSLVELLCNQFYDNILIPSQNQNNPELEFLIYKLLEDEIITMNSATIDDFLDDNTFMGKFLSTYIRKDEFRLFFGKLLKPIILSIESKDDDCLDMSLTNIKSKINKREKEKEKDKDKERGSQLSKNTSINQINIDKEGENYLNILYKDIKKTSIEFKKNIDLEDDKNPILFNNEDKINININNINIIDKSDKEEKINETSISNSDKNLPYLKQKSFSQINDEYNMEYFEDLDKDKIIKKILKEQNKDMKDFYIHQLEQINSDPYIFTNIGLKNILDNEQKENENILNKYKQNFIFIKNSIDSIIQELINKINIIPNSLRIICKIIYILITKKFPNLPKFYRNAFIGKFLFDKCIFPILSLDSKNAIINRIFPSSVKGCVNVIINVLENANRGCLYQTNSETEKTIFNYYLIEIIPLLSKFYEHLIDIKLPSFIDENLKTIDKQIEENLGNKIFHFNRRKNPNKSDNKEKNNIINNNIKNNNIYNDYIYDYFKENPEEIMRLQGICFSVSDVLFILSLINGYDSSKESGNSKRNDNLKLFQNLPEYEFFSKTIERIKCDDYKLNELAGQNINPKDSKEKKVFYVIFRDERNNQLENLLKAKRKNKNKFFIDDKSDKDSTLLINKIKFCIRNILKNIELNFSYINKANSTDKLFSALFYHLNEIGENSEIYDQIPIKWYAQYIYENKNNLDLNYRKNDYQLLYKEMKEEEKERLDELKNITSKTITKNNININCAADLVNKIKFSLDDIIEEKKLAKLEIFIDTEEIKVCMLITKNQKEIPKFQIREVEACDLNNNEFHKDSSRNKNKLSCHTRYIKDFINKFSYETWDKENKLTTPKKIVWTEIIGGLRKAKIYKVFTDYLNIIKKRMKDPIINKNLFKEFNEYNDLLEKISDYIFRQIYKYILPTKKMGRDEKLFKKTQSLSWITPNMLDIKNIKEKQLEYPIKCIKQLEEVKSVNDKLICIREAHASLNNVIKFSNGSDSDAGQDEITPLFQLIIIKAQPKKISTNISYIKTFLDESELSGSKGFLMTQMDSALSYIENVDENSFRMKELELMNNQKEK